MDNATLVRELTLFLTPFLTHLLNVKDKTLAKIGQQLGEELVPGLGDRVWKNVEILWNALGPSVAARPVVQDAMRDAANNPDDADAQATFRMQLRKLLIDETSLAQEVAHLWENAKAEKVTLFVKGNRNIVVSGTVMESTLISGDVKLFLAPEYMNTPAAHVPIDELTRAYLRALINDCRRLPLNVVAPRFLEGNQEIAPSLPSVYIDIDVQTPELKNGTKRDTPSESQPDRMPILEVLADEKLMRTVLLGDPGSGKSTLIQYLAYALAQTHLGEANANTLFPFEFASRDLIPVRLVLREVAAKHIPADARHGNAQIIWEALRSDLTLRLGADVCNVLFPSLQKSLLRDGGFFLFDGLDEVPTSDHRRERLIEAITDFDALLPVRHRIVVTARPYAYSDPKLRLPGFEALVVSPFSDAQIDDFIEHWYLAMRSTMGWDDETGRAKGNELREAIHGKLYLADLARRPLLLTLMATLNTSWGKLPEDRADLYEETVKLFLTRWQRAREVLGPDGTLVVEPGIARALNVEEKVIRNALHYLAYTVHTRQGKESKRQDIPADINADELLAAFAAVLPENTNPRVILDYLEYRASLLLCRAPGTYMFPHRSFQEYLAACYLLDQPQSAQALRERVWNNPTWWREVFLLGVGKKRISGLDDAVNLVNTLVPQSPEEIETIGEEHWRAAILAGQSLAEINLQSQSNGIPHYEAILTRVRRWLVALLEEGCLTPRDRIEAGDALASLGDPRPGVMVIGGVPDILWCVIPAGPFLMGSREDDRDAHNDEKPQFTYMIHNDYYIARYPITNAQYDAFVKDSEGYCNSHWWTKAGLQWREEHTYSHKESGAFILPNHPVIGISWYEAMSFTAWLTANLRKLSFRPRIWRNGTIETIVVDWSKYEVRLPTEAEWEKGAKGTDGRVYPWGGRDADSNRMNFFDTRLGSTNTVGCFPEGASPHDVLEMSGNVWEWTQSHWVDSYRNYLETEKSSREGNFSRVARGGAFVVSQWRARCACRQRCNPDYSGRAQGFRVVLCPI